MTCPSCKNSTGDPNKITENTCEIRKTALELIDSCLIRQCKLVDTAIIPEISQHDTVEHTEYSVLPESHVREIVAGMELITSELLFIASAISME